MKKNLKFLFMLGNYIKIMLRQVLRYKGYFLINVAGLAISIACVLYAFAFIAHEVSFDNFHDDLDRIYRLNKRNVSMNTGEESLTCETSGMMGPTIREEFPEVEAYTRLFPWFDEVVISYEDDHILIEQFVFADSTFFDVFSFNLLRGDQARVFKRPSTVVLTESLARTLFGSEDPIGRIVKGIHEVELEVTGIIQDPPPNSHIRFDALCSWTTTVGETGPLDYTFMNNWLGQTMFTYFKMAPNKDINGLAPRFKSLMERHFPERAGSYFLYLQPFKDIYLYSDQIRGDRNFKKGSIAFVRILTVIAILMIVIACTNYINITTAKASKRAGEVGVRKVMGAGRRQLVTQFIMESGILVLTATALALLLIDLSLPYFNELSGRDVDLSILLESSNVLLISFSLLVIILAAGWYPAILISAYRPVDTLKKESGRSSSGSRHRHVLTVVQFIISIVLIIATLVVYDQTRYLQTKSPGFNKEHIVVLNTNNSISENHESFRNELMAHPSVVSVAICQAAIGTGTFGTTVIPKGKDEEMSTQIFRVDPFFIDTYKMEIIKGRKFIPGEAEAGNLIVNETFVKMAGWDEPVGNTLRFTADGDAYPVIGVIKDFNYLPLSTSEIDPIVMYLLPDNYNNASVRIMPDNVAETLGYFNNLWEKYEQRFPFDYYFVDQWFNEQYASQEKLLGTVSLFSIISVLIACLGLYGLTAFTIEQRTKEIGIRKVFGASIMNIAWMINLRFLLLVSLAALIGVPVGYLLLNDWLQQFPYRINIELWMIGIAFITVLFIALIAVSIQAVKAAMISPVRSLKYE